MDYRSHYDNPQRRKTMEEAVKINLCTVLDKMAEQPPAESPDAKSIRLNAKLDYERLTVLFEMAMLVYYKSTSNTHALGYYIVEKSRSIEIIPPLAEQAVLQLSPENRESVVDLYIRPNVDRWAAKLEMKQRWSDIEAMRSNVERQCDSILEGTSVDW